MSDELVIVIGSHDSFDEWEASGMVGVGDALALAEISGYLRERAFTKFKVVSSKTIGPDDFNKNLIMIGGADANSASRFFIEKTIDQRSIKLGDPDKNVVSFSFDGKIFSPERGKNPADAGVIIFSSSPFNPESSSLLLSGCYGIGTLAAAKTVCHNRSFQRRVRWARKFEAAITCEVKGNLPVGTKVEGIIR